MYVAAWLPDILVESSTGTRPSVTGRYDVTRTSVVRWVTTKQLPIGCIKATRYTELSPMIRVQDIIKGELLRCWYVWVKERFYSVNIGGIIDDSFLKVKRAIVMCLKRNNCVVKTLFMSFV